MYIPERIVPAVLLMHAKMIGAKETSEDFERIDVTKSWKTTSSKMVKCMVGRWIAF